jgi:hypothetical protein
MFENGVEFFLGEIQRGRLNRNVRRRRAVWVEVVHLLHNSWGDLRQW